MKWWNSPPVPWLLIFWEDPELVRKKHAQRKNNNYATSRFLSYMTFVFSFYFSLEHLARVGSPDFAKKKKKLYIYTCKNIYIHFTKIIYFNHLIKVLYTLIWESQLSQIFFFFENHNNYSLKKWVILHLQYFSHYFTTNFMW